MMLNRRGFLSGMAAALALPAVVKADSLMRCPGVRLVLPRSAKLVMPGWLACDGGEISPFEYPALAAALDKLQVPDMRGRCQLVETRIGLGGTGAVVQRSPLLLHAVATGEQEGIPPGTVQMTLNVHPAMMSVSDVLSS